MKGVFSGEWGLDILGIPVVDLGWVEGYYTNPLLGRFEGRYACYNGGNTTFSIEGIYIGPFMFGKVVNLTTGNGIGFIGIGGYNATTSEFYFRLIGLLGPNFYMYGTYSKFE